MDPADNHFAEGLEMADSISGIKKKGKALVIDLPRRGKQRVEIPDQVMDGLFSALTDLELSREGIVVPEDEDPSSPRLFEKQHQAMNFGRKVRDELEARDPSLVRMVPRTRKGEDGQPVTEDQPEHLITLSAVSVGDAGFVMALSKK